MKLARYMGGGEVAIVEEDVPACPPGGLLVRTEASGLCSGELMDWYMDAKIPHVLGHEVSGIVVESDDAKFPVGSRVAPHHHAPCLRCELCLRGAYVHCEQWKRTKLVPGGMAEYFAVSAENLLDTILIDPGVRAQDAALIEPLACVMKAISRTRVKANQRTAVIGLGFMGLLHMLALRGSDVAGYDLNPARVEWARGLGLDASLAAEAREADTIYVCPGTEEAVRFAIGLASSDSNIVLFSPLPPNGEMVLPFNQLYFRDVNLITSYSCGPNDTRAAYDRIRVGDVRAEMVVSDFISIEDLPRAYRAMKAGEILKPMVMF